MNCREEPLLTKTRIMSKFFIFMKNISNPPNTCTNFGTRVAGYELEQGCGAHNIQNNYLLTRCSLALLFLVIHSYVCLPSLFPE